MIRIVRTLVTVTLASALTGCQELSAEICPPLLEQLRGSLVAQGIDPASGTFQKQYASAMQACLRDPGGFGSLLRLPPH